MPSLDLSEVLTEPAFTDTFKVTNSIGTVGSGGMETDAFAEPDDAEGVVVPGETKLFRAGDGARFTAYIEIFTQYPLSAGSKANDVTHRDADIILWHGRKYTVMVVDDFSAFGDGFVHASCDLLDLNPA